MIFAGGQGVVGTLADVVAGEGGIVLLTRFHLFSGAERGRGGGAADGRMGVNGVVIVALFEGACGVTGAERGMSPAGPLPFVDLTKGRRSLPTAKCFLTGTEAGVDNVLCALGGTLAELRLILLTAAVEGRIGSDGMCSNGLVSGGEDSDESLTGDFSRARPLKIRKSIFG